MPTKDDRGKASGKAGKHATAGRMRVSYRDAKGNTMDALVLGAGSVSGVKIKIMSGSPSRIIDNVAAATGLKQTNVYFSR